MCPLYLRSSFCMAMECIVLSIALGQPIMSSLPFLIGPHVFSLLIGSNNHHSGEGEPGILTHTDSTKRAR